MKREEHLVLTVQNRLKDERISHIYFIHSHLIRKQSLTRITKNYLTEIHLKLVDTKQCYPREPNRNRDGIEKCVAWPRTVARTKTVIEISPFLRLQTPVKTAPPVQALKSGFHDWSRKWAL